MRFSTRAQTAYIATPMMAIANRPAKVVGASLRAGLERELADVPGFVEIRGQGLMLGIQLDRPCGELLSRAAKAGLLISVTADSVVRLLPPLILTADEAAQIVVILAPLIKAYLAEPKP